MPVKDEGNKMISSKRGRRYEWYSPHISQNATSLVPQEPLFVQVAAESADMSAGLWRSVHVTLERSNLLLKVPQTQGDVLH
jgi:hypothetical protein